MVRRRSTVRFRNGAPQELACEARSEAHWTALILRCGWELFPCWEESGRSPSRGVGRASPVGPARPAGELTPQGARLVRRGTALAGWPAPGACSRTWFCSAPGRSPSWRRPGTPTAGITCRCTPVAAPSCVRASPRRSGLAASRRTSWIAGSTSRRRHRARGQCRIHCQAGVHKPQPHRPGPRRHRRPGRPAPARRASSRRGRPGLPREGQYPKGRLGAPRPHRSARLPAPR